MKSPIKQIQKALINLKNSKPKIVVIGDLILDEYLIGYPERISREAPVLILEYKESYYRLGGAANAAINAAHLGANVTLIGSVGRDNAAKEMARICEKNKINFQTIEIDSKPTTLKTRILSTNQGSNLSHAGTSLSQQVLRIDRQNKKDISASESKELLDLIKKNSEDADCILISDFILGLLNDEVVQQIINLNSRVVVDPSSSFNRFKGTFLLTPNEPDTEKELNQSLDFSSGSSIASVKKLLAKKVGERTNFLITRGSSGMALFDNSFDNTLGKAFLIPAFNKAEVFDVTGAGDTVSACVCFGIASGLSLLESIILGNLAASIVVRKSGAATTTQEEMLESLEKLRDFEVQEFKLF
ncbi:MAG: bifunctional ADP-heptose synthase [Candidatus Caenarcaniphilales bacterium]|nr:bifunctional ADP-heptose synthase [Candidatus Caenarcaniphilales bacterium]